ncbi:MAG: hypothetical protein HY318_07415 [Armatimonadetes bacterium]|nr:hypothetical protein [Armatimonadota bacterium]
MRQLKAAVLSVVLLAPRHHVEAKPGQLKRATEGPKPLRVQVDPGETIGYISPLIYGVEAVTVPATPPPAEGDRWMSEIATHGARMMRLQVEEADERNLSSLIGVLKQARLNGLSTMLTFHDLDDVPATEAAIQKTLSALADEGMSVSRVELPKSLSDSLVQRLSARETVKDVPEADRFLDPWRALSDTCFYLRTSLDPPWPLGDGESLCALFSSALPLRFGLAVSGSSELTADLAAMLQKASRDLKTTRKAASIGLFCPVELSALFSSPESQGEDRVATLLASALMSLPAQGATLAATRVEDPASWFPVALAYQLLSGWGSVYGLQASVVAPAPLKAWAARTPGRTSLCLINPEDTDLVVRVEWKLTTGIYSVASRGLRPGRGYLSNTRLESPLLVTRNSPPRVTTTSVPARGMVVLRCESPGYLASQGLLRLLSLARDGSLEGVPAQKRALIRNILDDANRSAMKIQNGFGENTTRNRAGFIRSAHRALLRVAQVEAMLKNYALRGRSAKYNYNNMVSLIDDVTERLSEASALLMRIKLRADSAAARVKPGDPFILTVEVTNNGDQVVRNLRFFREPSEDLAVLSDSSAMHRFLRPGQTRTVNFRCKVSPSTRFRISLPVGVGVTYYANQSYAWLRREVEVGITP